MNTHFYDNQWHPGSGSRMLEATSPSTNEVIWRGAAAEAAEVDAAMQSARAAFNSWSRLKYEEREALIKAYQDALIERQAELAACIARDVGKPLWEAKTEAAAMVAKIDLSITSYQQRTGTTSQQGAAFTTALTHRPHGVMVILGPYNFPGHLPNGHLVPALLAGNTVVHKPSEVTPTVAQIMIECLAAANIPSGVVNLVQGDGATGLLLTQHADTDGVLFTGSTRTGIALHKQFAGQPGKMLALEMGGNNPLIVHRSNDHKAAVFHTLQSAYITSGQRCTCARRLILIDDAEGHEFADALQAGIGGIRVALPNEDENAFMGPVVHNRVADQLMQAQAELIEQGAVSLVSMTRPKLDFSLLTPGLIDVTNVADLADEELFGPLLTLQWARDLDHAITLANDTEFGLSAGMFTDDDASWNEFYARIRAGIVNRNRPLTGASGGAPFGGIGASGNHRASAFYAADYCAYPMASMLEDTIHLPDSLGPGITL